MSRTGRNASAGVLAWALLVRILVPARAEADAFHVPTVEHPTIAAALADAVAWDTIFVDAKTYGGELPVTVDVDVDIQSLDGAPVSYPAFLVRDATLRLQDGTVDTWSYVEGTTTGGLFVGDFAGVVVLDGTFEGTRVDLYGGGGAGVIGVDSIIRLTDAEVTGFSEGQALESYAFRGDTTLDVADSAFSDNGVGAIWVSDAEPSSHYVTVDISETTFAGNRTGEYGGDLYLYSVDRATIAGLSSQDAAAATGGGSVFLYNTDATFTGCAFTDSEAPSGGALYAVNDTSIHTLALTEVSFVGGTATDGLAGAGGDVAIGGYTFEANGISSAGASAVYGGSFYVAGGSFVLADAHVSYGVADLGGAVFLDTVEGAEVRDAHFCANVASYGGALYAAYGSTTVETTVGVGNVTTEGGVVQVAGGSLTVGDATFVDNEVSTAVVDVADAYPVLLVNTIFQGSRTALAFAGVTLTAGYNLYWDLDVAGAGHATYGADVKADPLFVDTFDPADCSTEPYLQAGSPALGTGDPARADHDIGAYSAQTADPGPDNDGDGVPDGLDCEAEDATVYPGAWDNPLDDIDQDCDGEAASGVAHGGCGCATGVGTGGGAGLVAALGLLVAARRRGPIA